MSVSLIVLRLEIAEEFSLLDHLHFSVPKYNRAMALPDVNQKKVDGNEASSESVVKRYRGSRELRDISIETFNGDDASGIKNTDDDVKSGSAGGCSSGTVKTSSPSKKLREEKKKIKALKANGLKNNSSKSASSNIQSNGSEGPGKPEVKKSATEVLPSQVTATETLKNTIPSGILDKSTDVLQISAIEKNPSDVKEVVTTSVESSVNAVERRNRLSLPTPVPFSSGNHFVDVTKGLLHLYKENQRTTLAEEAERSEMLCILAVPAAMTTHDLLQFTAPANEDIEHMRIIREAKPNQYMVLIKFRSQLAADVFYKNFNGTKFNSIEPEVCHLAFVAKVETVKESEEASLPIPGHTELPTCPVCLERMDESVEGILTILCNHSFHGSCLAKWGDTSCPVCRYCQTPELTPDNRCFGCGSQDSLWICLICGHVGCGRYVDGHAYQHYLDTQHTFAMQLGNNRVWDYAGDNYVHRLVQNKADGKPVELEPLWVENEEKMDSMQLEYTYLLTSQLEAQRHYFEDRLSRFETEAHKQLEDMKEKTKQAVDERKQLEEKLNRVSKEKQSQEKKIQQLTTKLNKALLELKDEKEMNKCLRQNQVIWQQRLAQMEKNFKEMTEKKDKEIQEMQEQVRDLMFYLEAKDKLHDVPNVSAQEIQEGQIVVGASGGPPSSESTRPRRKKNS